MRQLFFIALLAVASSCAADNVLGGSVSELFPLDVSRVEVQKNDEALQVTYLRNRGVFLDVVVRVSISTRVEGMSEDGGRVSYEFKAGNRIPLKGTDPYGVQRVSVTHAPGGEPVRNFPEVTNGDLLITGGGEIGEETSGNFSMVFAKEGGDLGFGRTLTGTFRGETLDAGFGELP